MSAQLAEFPRTTTPVTIPRARRTRAARLGPVSPLPFPAPLIHPRATEALLLAFRSLEERPGEGA